MAEPRTVRENANSLTSEDIAAILPHRYPFALVDRILDYEPGQWAIGRKCVTRNEEFFCGHFPGQPVMPGVLILEALAQFSPTGGGLTGYSDALYTTQLSASATATGSTRCSLLAACERQLLEQAVAVPLFTQQKRLLVANGIEGLVFDPFGPVLDVTYATKSK